MASAIHDHNLSCMNVNIANPRVDALAFVADGTSITVANLPRGFAVSRSAVGEYEIKCPQAETAVVVAAMEHSANILVDTAQVEDGIIKLTAATGDSGSPSFCTAVVAMGDVK
jgi:hypothetical protein